MFLNKSLGIALLISTLFHTGIFLPFPHIANSSVKKALAPLKITYLAPSKPKEIPSQRVRPEKKPKKLVSRQENREIVAAKFKQDKNLVPKRESVKKVAYSPKPASEDLRIEIPAQLPKEKEALYLDYYRSIRERIRRQVLENYPRFIACGEVRLYFVLLSNGKLKDIRVIEGGSSHNRPLKEIAKKSVREASPFLPFPKDLNLPDLSFNVIISFELEN